MAQDVRASRRLGKLAKHGGRVDVGKLRATTDEDLQRHMAEDGERAGGYEPSPASLPDPKQIRERLRLSQDGFAAAIGIPVATVRDWEQHRTEPDPAAISLLRIVEREPDAAFRARGSRGKPRNAGPRHFSD